MSNVIPFPNHRLERVDMLCKAIAEDKGPRELITFEAHPGAVCVRVVGLELWLTPDECEEVAHDLIEAAFDARAKE